ncbi:MAG: MBL fold metallo-hydrolase [Bacteroidales bacterium]|nr:MBL fold metallo-hydrolase [Bacteroidales bacterium]
MNLKRLLFILGVISSGIVSAATFDTDTFLTQKKENVILTFIGHGSLMLSYNNQIIQIDPVTRYADYSTLPKADAILITHEHGDHLDAKAIETLTKKETLLFVNEASGKKLGKGSVMKNGEKKTILDRITIETVAAYNITPGRENLHPRFNGNGYVLTMDGLRIYIAGDTEDIPEMKELKNIDVAFLPVNQPYTMTVSQAANAAKMFSPKVLYPYHYANTAIEELKTILKGTSIDVRIRKME